MKGFVLGIAAVVALGGAAVAETTTIKRTETPLGESTTVKRENWDGSTTTRRTETTGSIGCDTKSVTRTNDDGDTTTKTRTSC